MSRRISFYFVLSSLAFSFSIAPAQKRSSSRPLDESNGDVIRINSDLVHTDVVVLDRQGHFVDGLKSEDFELRVDEKPQIISFFEQIMTGSSAEEKRLAIVRGKPDTASILETPAGITEHRRTMIFFIDDLHLGLEELLRTRRLLQDFVDNHVFPSDQVLIASANGQIGFLQQFTDSKEMLHTAIARLRYQSRAKLDTSLLPMTEYEALAVDRNEWGVINKKINEVLANYSLPTTKKEKLADLKARAEQEVRNTARQILQQSTATNKGMLTTLERLARATSGIRARKLLFFISEGFVVDRRSSEVQDRLQRVIDAAARNGVAIYTADPRGLFATFADASNDVVATESHVDTTSTDASVAHQVLRTLAADTGGRAILNNNNLEAGIMKALEETAGYYLLAWRPDVVDQGKPKFRHVKITVKTRPDLTVLARRGFFNASYQPSPEYAADNNKVPAVSLPNYVLNKQLNSSYPRRDLPVFLYPSFNNDPQRGSTLTISAQFGNGEQIPEHSETSMVDIDVAYVLLNAEGKTVSSSGKKLTGIPDVQKPQAPDTALVSEFSISIAPGLYQIRLAARDNYAGRVGGALEWIEIPRFEQNHLTLSSLLLSEQRPGELAEETRLSNGSATLDVDRTFDQNSRLLCQTYIYNAALLRGTDPPQITMEISIFQENKLIANAPTHSLATRNLTDFTRIPYAFPLPLNSFPQGLYTIRVTAIDRETNRRASQSTNFRIQ